RGELIDHRDHGGLVVVDRGLQQVGTHRELLGQRLQSVAKRGSALGQSRQRRALQIVFGEIDHHRDRLLDGRDVLARLGGGVRRQRQIERIGGYETRGERFARFSQRRQQQGVASADGALDDSIKPRHFPSRLEYFIFVGVRDRRLQRAHLAK